MNKQDPLRKVSSQRLPPPALFQGPPSHNASNPSLPQPSSTTASRGPSQPPPLQRNRSAHTVPVPPHPASLEAPAHLPPQTRAQKKREIDGSEAIWQEMQSALSEVELSAVSGEHVFGEKHSRALEDLRTKQLKLAHAWARSESEDEIVDPDESGQSPNAISPMMRPSITTTTAGETDDKTSTIPGPGSGSGAATGTATGTATGEKSAYKTLDEETEKDILLARERREANDRYFDRVNNGVLDVVAKLEEVAQAMRVVQRESTDIWSESDSMSVGGQENQPG